MLDYKNTPTTIFFTGGSGFVGQQMIPKLIAAGHKVMALARSEAAAKKVAQVGAQAVMDDLCQLSERTAQALSQCTIVVHSAAYMDFNYETEKFYSINVEATKNLLKLAAQQGIKRFIYISAAPVVPGSPIVRLQEKNAPKGLPKALYPKTKALAEQAVLAANSKSMTTISLRPPAIWGNQNPHVEEMLEMVKAQKWVWIGGGHQILSTVHVYNLSAAVLAAFQYGKGGEAYFITDSDQRSMRTTFGAIFEAHGASPSNRSMPLWLASGMANFMAAIWRLLGKRSRPPLHPLMIRLMAREFSVINQKARTELHYQPCITFQEGIEEIRQNTRSQQHLTTNVTK